MISTFSRTRVAGALIGAALVLTVVAPGAAAGQDMRTPDVLDGAERSPSTGAGGTTTYPDQRTPDARDSGGQAAPGEDRRSPDARVAPSPTFESKPLADAPTSPGGFDLVSAAIGAAAGAGLLTVLAAFLGMSGIAGRRQGTLRA